MRDEQLVALMVAALCGTDLLLYDPLDPLDVSVLARKIETAENILRAVRIRSLKENE